VATSSPWTRPPEPSTRYRLPARLSDMLHGWADGRRGIPLLHDVQTHSADAASAPDTEVGTAQPGDHQAESGQPAQLPEPWTPRMEVLLRRSRELTEGERIGFADDWSLLRRRSGEYQKSADALQEQVTALRQQLDKARLELSDKELRKRRLAEQNEQSRPEALVNDRRQAAWQRQLAAAEERYQSANARLAEARQALMLQEDLIRERAAVARAAARRHREFALRRVATYLQQLVRSHRRGAELNDWLMVYRVMPDLPAWAQEPSPGESGAEQIIAGGISQMTTGSDVRDEASGP
jgi:hypothetical protein